MQSDNFPQKLMVNLDGELGNSISLYMATRQSDLSKVDESKLTDGITGTQMAIANPITP